MVVIAAARRPGWPLGPWPRMATTARA